MTNRAAENLRDVPRARVAATLAAALFMLLYAALYAAAHVDSTRATLTTLFTTVAAISALAAALWALRSVPREKRGVWIAMSVSGASFSAAWVYRLVVVAQTTAYPATGTFEDYASLTGFLALIPAVILMSQPRQGVRLTHLRQALDLLGIALAVLAGLALLLLIPLRLVGAEMGVEANVAFGGYVTLSAALTLYLLAFKRTPWTSAEALVLAGLVSGSLAILAIFSALSRYQPTTLWSALPNSLLTAGFLFFGLAGVHAATRRSVFSPGSNRMMVMPAWTQHASTAVAMIAVPWLIVAASTADSSFTRGFLTIVAVILAITVAGRNMVVTAENTQLSQRSIHDPLTGLFNEQHLHDQVLEELTRAEAADTDVCVCMLVLDDQDERIRQHGFASADNMIRIAARRIETAAGMGLAYRIGSDRFALLLGSTNAVEAYETCASCARAMASEDPENPPTLSIGIASARLTTWDAEALVDNARGAVYWATSTGGDRIVLFDPEVVVATDSRSHVAGIEKQSHTRLLQALAAAVDARDPYTRHHSANVAKLADALARHLEFTPDRVELVREAALMHDLGKIGIVDSILAKPAGLTDSEYAKIRTHSELGARILSSGSSSEIIPWVRSHHERWDGEGYPDGLAGDEIPYEARMLTICDSYDAMTSDRPYRQGFGVSEAVGEMRSCAGTQFDPDLVEPFLEALFEMWPETGGRAFRIPESNQASSAVPAQDERPAG